MASLAININLCQTGRWQLIRLETSFSNTQISHIKNVFLCNKHNSALSRQHKKFKGSKQKPTKLLKRHLGIVQGNKTSFCTHVTQDRKLKESIV